MNPERDVDAMYDSPGLESHPALTDPQTGLPNRLHFRTVFEVMFAAGSRGIPISLLLLEIEGFHTWAAGADPGEIDRVLRGIGDTLGPVVRATDLVVRLDENRLVVCLVDCNMAGAVLVADRIDGLLDPLRQRTGLGFSLGGASMDVDMKLPADLLAGAEAALTAAQAKGPNHMEFHR